MVPGSTNAPSDREFHNDESLANVAMSGCINAIQRAHSSHPTISLDCHQLFGLWGPHVHSVYQLQPSHLSGLDTLLVRFVWGQCLPEMHGCSGMLRFSRLGYISAGKTINSCWVIAAQDCGTGYHSCCQPHITFSNNANHRI